MVDKAKGKDHHRYCWSCGNYTMAPTDTWWTCTECGATYTDPITIGKADKGVMVHERAAKGML